MSDKTIKYIVVIIASAIIGGAIVGIMYCILKTLDCLTVPFLLWMIFANYFIDVYKSGAKKIKEDEA